MAEPSSRLPLTCKPMTVDKHVEPAKAWLAECLATHESCAKKPTFNAIWCSGTTHEVRDLTAESSMPKRLLSFDIEPTGTDMAKVVDVSEVTAYFALSHRWGTQETCKALLSNIADLTEEGIAVEQLPKTFREAVEFTRSLGYAHLWIDSLCIVQDDTDDWRGEAKRMACVYGNSVCTISAIDARDNDGGLVSPAPSPDDDGLSLDSRAWVLQERMIPPRTLLFTGGAVHWECREADATMEARDLVSRDKTASSLEAPKDLFTFFRDWRVPDDSIQQDQHMVIFTDVDTLRGEREDYAPFLKAWWRFLGHYTTRRLTRPADRYLALNGIASTTLRWAHMRHFWGAWSPFAFEELGWCIDRDGPEGTRSAGWLAPWWSWANTNNGRAINRFYERLPKTGVLQLKPVARVPQGMSFDTPLPHPVWTCVSHFAFEIKGPLRRGHVTPGHDSRGKRQYSVSLEQAGRWSEDEVFEFWPDCASEFPIDRPSAIVALRVWHYNKDESGFPQYIDTFLVLQMMVPREHSRPPLASSLSDDDPRRSHVNSVSGRVAGTGRIQYGFDGRDGYKYNVEFGWNEMDALDDESEKLYAGRTFKRVGYMEATYDVRRSMDDINDEHWLRAVRLI